jgi:hypothetical protein
MAFLQKGNRRRAQSPAAQIVKTWKWDSFPAFPIALSQVRKEKAIGAEEKFSSGALSKLSLDLHDRIMEK